VTLMLRVVLEKLVQPINAPPSAVEVPAIEA
jgi:hypothetical protein